MVCDSIAVVRTKISPDLAAVLMEQPAILEALKAGLEERLGRTLTLSATETYATLGDGDLTITLDRYGLSVKSYRWGRVDLAEATRLIEQYAQELAVALTFQKTVKAIQAKHPLANVSVDPRTSVATIKIQY